MGLFVYGTLQLHALMEAVASGTVPKPIPAQLSGYEVTRLPGDVVPTITPKGDTQAEGQLFLGLTAEQIERLDRFEVSFGYERHEVTVTTDKGDVQADVYLPPKDAPSGCESWSLDGWAETNLTPMIYAVEELFSHDPWPTPEQLKIMWPVIEKRAWARHRALQTTDHPAELRHDAVAGDAQIHGLGPPKGEFFRIQGMDVDHRRFDGTKSDRLRREVFLGIDAALVLPYDPATDHVLLIEQARMGPLRRGDANPWQLEPIAGMTDARETPEEAALREAKEEADLDLSTLEQMFAIYPSPGSSTDYFYCYCALCDLPEQKTYTGGLEEEAEDLRIHVLPLQRAIELIDTGEISVGPLIAMLLWVERQKGRLRGLS